MHLLYVDLLGSRSRWTRGGREAAEASFQEFERLARDAIQTVHQHAVRWVGIESDSLVVVCGSVQDTVELARSLFLRTFLVPPDAPESRLWLRGVVLRYDGDPTTLREEEVLAPNFTAYRYSEELAEAISVERSGVKGMRLLIKDDAITAALRRTLALPIGDLHFVPIRKLTYSGYPPRLGERYRDVLWMASTDQDRWDEHKLVMAKRLRLAAGDEQEFLVASSTNLVFTEAGAIAASLALRDGAEFRA